MEIKSENYKEYINCSAKDIPGEDLTEIIVELTSRAMFYMHSTLKDDEIKATIQSIVYFLKKEFGFMPIHLVGEAFMSGSVGRLGGTTKFTVRNVCIWFDALRENFERLRAQKISAQDDTRKREEEKIFKLKHREDYIFGTALAIKATWSCAGLIGENEWDKYTLDIIVEKLHQGYDEKTLVPSMILL